MKRTEQQQRALHAKGRRYAKRQDVGGRSTCGLMRQAYVAGFLAGERTAVKAPALTLLHVLDTQRELKATIARLRDALRNVGNAAIQEAAK